MDSTDSRNDVDMMKERLFDSDMDSSDARSDASIIKTCSVKLVRTLLGASLPTLVGTSLVAIAADGSGDYVDTSNGFKVTIPPAWASMPRKVPPPPTMTQFQTENVVLVANSFVEGAALSVTRANAGRLLKDFEIEWWFAPLEKFKDVGDSKLVAELMILQRQGEFEKKQTSSEIKNARFSEKNVLEFDYITPLAAEVNRKTICKAYFLPESKEIRAVWVSALTGVFESDYGETLDGVARSFALM